LQPHQRARHCHCHCRPKDITWHETNWDNPDSRFLAWTLHDSSGDDVLIAFNAHGFEVPCKLPKPPAGRKWARFIDTNLPPPKDVTPGVAPHSAIVLVAKAT
jgi:isoamylase